MSTTNTKGNKMTDLMKRIKNNCGFIDMFNDLPELVKENRFQQVLIRCGNGRFVTPAQDVENFVRIINNSDEDYVRDISLPVGYI